MKQHLETSFTDAGRQEMRPDVVAPDCRRYCESEEPMTARQLRAFEPNW
jgi:hypothetical protein